METAIIAGVGPGTGAALARAFAKEGYAIGLLSRHLESSQPVADEIRARGGKALVVPTDVTVRQSAQTAVGEIRNHFGPITALCERFAHTDWPPVLERQATLVNPLLPDIERAGFPGY